MIISKCETGRNPGRKERTGIARIVFCNSNSGMSRDDTGDKMAEVLGSPVLG